jgi:hypothetical protein
MSYFKPLNSNENNLHIIRASIDNTGNITAPSKNQLPSTFTTSKFDDNNFTINYNNIFNSSITPSIFVISTDDSKFGILTITNKNSSNCRIHSTYPQMSNLDIMIVGPQSTGPVFAVSNRGWKFSTNLNQKLLYSDADMLVGIGTDNPNFNFTINGNYGVIPNKIYSSKLESSNLLNYYLNIININTSKTISLPSTTNDGQLLNIVIGNSVNQDAKITLDINSNILSSSQLNIILQTIGDSISLCSYNNKWIITNTNINQIATSPTYYNSLLTSQYIYDSETFNSTLLNNQLTVLTVNSNTTISLPSSYSNNGKIIDLVVGQVINSSISNISNNYILPNSQINLNNIGDKVKLLANGHNWLILDR